MWSLGRGVLAVGIQRGGNNISALTPVAINMHRDEGTSYGFLDQDHNHKPMDPNEYSEELQIVRGTPEGIVAHDRVVSDARETYELIIKVMAGCRELLPNVPLPAFGAEPLGLPEPKAWKEFAARIRATVEKRIHDINKDRISREIGIVDNDKGRSYAKAFATVKDPYPAPTVCVQNDEGKLVFEPSELHETIRQAWVKPIFQKYSENNPPGWDSLIYNFAEEIGPKIEEVTIPKIDGLRLKQRAAKVSGTFGLDSWRREEINRLPAHWWHLIAVLFQSIEDTDNPWPHGLTQAAVPLIPKDGSTDPMTQRPLTILSCIYRAYAGLRYDDLQPWRDMWVSESIFGGERDREAVQANLDAALDVEEAQITDSPFIVAFLDYSKFFDSLVWQIIWAYAKWMGAPAGLMNAIAKFYANLESRFKVNGHYGRSWHRTNSVAQGCPLSIVLANLIGALWSKVLDARAPDIRKIFLLLTKQFALMTGSNLKRPYSSR